ncbi:hypothetical protein GPS55_16225, partial [Acinetobacter haemolyticus]|nr:hypothetical protein [Acinetobacter haemolyticus]NAS10272.1 hypothetical protein [Acinetobacter haemolyticus]
PINESAIIGRPVGCTISFRSRFIHFEIIGLNKPYRLGLCNKALQNLTLQGENFSLNENERRIKFSFKYKDAKALGVFKLLMYLMIVSHL